jgi:DNA-nicking Smr family endonuclease|tara:strand:+ start:100 stop:324 length:225 start_codon:yes stop_codon:yes gene_type:complete
VKSIDLHNLPHDVAERVVFNFIMNNCDNMPVEIITGKSDRMRQIVIDIVEHYNFGHHYSKFSNAGSLIITESAW